MATALERSDVASGQTVAKYSPLLCQTRVFGVWRRVRVRKTPLSCIEVGGRDHAADEGLLTLVEADDPFVAAYPKPASRTS